MKIRARDLPIFGAALALCGCSTAPAVPRPDLSSGTPYCADMALWELPDYPARIPAPSGAIVTEGGSSASGAVDVSLKTLGTPEEVSAFYACALPFLGYDKLASLTGDERGFEYSRPDGVRGRVVVSTYDAPFPDDGWDTLIRIVQGR